MTVTHLRQRERFVTLAHTCCLLRQGNEGLAGACGAEDRLRVRND